MALKDIIEQDLDCIWTTDRYDSPCQSAVLNEALACKVIIRLSSFREEQTGLVIDGAEIEVRRSEVIDLVERDRIAVNGTVWTVQAIRSADENVITVFCTTNKRIKPVNF